MQQGQGEALPPKPHFLGVCRVITAELVHLCRPLCLPFECIAFRAQSLFFCAWFTKMDSLSLLGCDLPFLNLRI